MTMPKSAAFAANKTKKAIAVALRGTSSTNLLVGANTMEEGLRGVFVEIGPPNSCGLGSETILLKNTDAKIATVKYIVRGALAGIIGEKTVKIPPVQTYSSGYCTYVEVAGAKQSVSVQIVQVTY